MKIYIVSGAYGELDDYTEWLVKAFTTHDKAAEYAILCKGEADRIREIRNKPQLSRFVEKHKLEESLTNLYDPNMNVTHYEVNYFVEELELEE